MARRMQIKPELAGLERTGAKNKPFSGIATVRIIIGIFQKKEDVTSFHRHRKLDITSLTEVGPFFSKSQALTWMKELHGKIENSEIAYIPESGEDTLKWYGFTFEE